MWPMADTVSALPGSPWPWWFLQVFLLHVSDTSCWRASSCLSGIEQLCSRFLEEIPWGIRILQIIAIGPNTAATYFCEWNFTGMQPCPDVCIVSGAVFVLQQQSWIVTRDPIARHVSKLRNYLLLHPLQKLFAIPYSALSWRSLWDLALSYRSGNQLTNPLVLACFRSLTPTLSHQCFADKQNAPSKMSSL